MELAQTPPATFPASLRAIGGGLLILAFVLIAYLPVAHAGFIWDDDDYVTQNQTLHNATGLKQIWLDPRSIPQYYPLVHTTFWVEHQLWGLNPVGYHVTNLVLHALAAMLLWRLLLLLDIPGAWVIACLFAVHPVHVESVAWVTERKNVLSLVFYLGSMLAYFRFDRPVESEERKLDWKMYALSMMFFLCAMLSKTVACSLPAAIALIFWWKRGRVTLRDMARLAPMFAVGLTLGLMTAWLEKNHVGAEGKDWSLSIIDRMLVAGRAVWFYAGKIVWPMTLTFIYPRWEIDSSAAWQYLLPAAAVSLVVLLWLLRKRLGRGPLVAVLLFGGTLLPALGFVDLYPMRYSFVADHFQYAASIALIALLVAAAAKVLSQEHLTALGCALVIVLSVMTWRQSHIYRSEETLWTDTLEKNPNCWMAENNYAVWLLGEGDEDRAFSHAWRSLAIKPDHAEAHNALGVILARRGRNDDATIHYAEALRLKPQYARAHVNWGVMLARSGWPAEAIGHFETAAAIKPRNVDALYNWATACMAMGKLDQAEALYRRTLDIAPAHARANAGLGSLLASQGRADAIKPAALACDLTDWKDAELIGNYAVACASAGRADEARTVADRAINTARVAGQGDLADEIAAWRQSLDSVHAGTDAREAVPR